MKKTILILPILLLILTGCVSSAPISDTPEETLSHYTKRCEELGGIVEQTFWGNKCNFPNK